jgi:tetratricopeptide (TPR) repeat protein
MSSMKKSILLVTGIIILAMAADVNAQDQPQGKASKEYLRQLNIYRKATFYNDQLMIRSAIYNLIEIDPTDNSLLDSLAFNYYSYRQYTSCLLVTLESLKRNPNNLTMMELKGICWENIGDASKALDSYESLFLKTNASLTLYKIGYLQLSLNRLNEASTSVEILLGKPDAEEIQISFNIADNTTQDVPLKAAALNLKGLIAKEKGDNEEAKKQFNEALKVAPDFELVKNNLKDLEG